MDRRRFLGTAAAGAAGLAVAGKRGWAGVASGDQPNVIIILDDDLGYGDLGCYGSQSIATPNLDRLAGEGVRLTSFFSSAAVCSPSRAGLLTGRYPVRTGIPSVLFPSQNPATPMIHSLYGLPPGLNPREITLGQAMKNQGRATAAIGKWHLGDLKPYRANHRGFDRFFGLQYSNDMTPLPLFMNDEVVERSPVNQDLLTQKYTREAVRFIAENKDRPFFLYLAHTFPHVPLHASPEFRGRSKGGLYGDCVEEMDWSVGEVMKALDQHGIAGRTFIFFTSDNGPWYQGNPGRFRGRKNETFDGGMRVPGLARWPGVIPAGKVVGEMAMNFDLFATALAVAGGKPPADRPIDGMNILPLLQGEPTPHDALFFYKGRELQAIRSGKWKYHRRHNVAIYPFFSLESGPKKGPLLFDLERDPAESYDVPPNTRRRPPTWIK